MDEAPRVERHRASFVDVDLRNPAANAFGIELVVPGAIERVRQVHPPAVAADLDHLRPAVDRLIAGYPIGRRAADSSELDGTGVHRIERIADVITAQLAGAEAGDVKRSIVE